MERLVDRHLIRFAGDATASLAHLGSVEEIREALVQLAAADSDALKTMTVLCQRIDSGAPFWKKNLALLAERMAQWHAAQCESAIKESDVTAT